MLLYGGLSDVVLVSNKAADGTKQFWQCLATWMGNPFKKIDEVLVAGGCNIIDDWHEQTNSQTRWRQLL
jgi:hypothetical protein